MLGTRVSPFSAFAGILLVGGLTACSDVAGNARVPVSLSVSGIASAPAASSLMSASIVGPSQSVTITSGTNTIVISKAQVVLSHIELGREESASCVTTGDESGCEEMKVDPMLVDLPVTPTVTQEISVTLPAGTYHELEAQVRAPHSGEPGADSFLAAHPDFAGKSLHVEGTFNGKAFVYDGAPQAEIEVPFNPPLTVATSSANNVTVHVDISSWFKDASGNVVDPTDPANAFLIVQNIRHSFHAFEDHNRDGVED